MPPLTIVIDLDPNLIQLGPFLVTWHGVFSVLGIIAAARLGAWLLERRDGVTPDRVYDMAFWMIVAGLIGARLLYVWENYQQFAGGPWYKPLLLNEGGISQWGGIFGALIGGYLWSLRNRFSYWKVIDAAGPANAVGFLIGRIGDVINGEHHAIPTTLPWGVEYVNPHTLGQPGLVVHPEVAYEMVLCLLLLGALLPFWNRMRDQLPAGVTGLTWLALYAAGRTLLSFLREDSLFLGLRQAQWAGLAMVAIWAIAVPILLRRQRRRQPEPEDPAMEAVA
ncbi:MAG TPA: prolipoprotein diacylglyceryl transferase family protein [Candidatus Dormibacteraeota bacterium]